MIQCAFALAIGLALAGCGSETTNTVDGTTYETTPPPTLFVPEPGEDSRCIEAYNQCVVEALQKPGKASQPHVEKCLREKEACDAS
jgi:hypothetical protein